LSLLFSIKRRNLGSHSEEPEANFGFSLGCI